MHYFFSIIIYIFFLVWSWLCRINEGWTPFSQPPPPSKKRKNKKKAKAMPPILIQRSHVCLSSMQLATTTSKSKLQSQKTRHWIRSIIIILITFSTLLIPCLAVSSSSCNSNWVSFFFSASSNFWVTCCWQISQKEKKKYQAWNFHKSLNLKEIWKMWRFCEWKCL